MSPSSAGWAPSSASSRTGRFFARFEARVAPFAHRFGDAPVAVALREAVPWSFAGLIAGLALFAAAGRGTIEARLAAAIPGGFMIASCALIVLLALALVRRLHMPARILVPTTLVVFVLTLPRPHGNLVAEYAATLGASGLFLAIVVALACAGALELGRRRAPRYRGYLFGAISVVAVAAVFALCGLSLATFLANAIEPLGALGDSFAALFVIAILETALWIVGVHGPALLAAVVTPIYLKLQMANTQAAAAHPHGAAALPHIVTVSTFLFVFPGGVGATLPLVLILAHSRSQRLRRIAYATVIPAVLNSNEPLILGIPLVFNPILAVPFVAAPAVLSVTTYAAMALGFVDRPVYYIPSPVPTLFAVVLATRDWRALVLAIANIAIAAAIYLPFVRIYERSERGER